MRYVYLSLALVALLLSGCAPQNQAQGLNLNGLQQPADKDPFDPQRPPTAQTLYVMADLMIAQGQDRPAEAMLMRIEREYPEYRPAFNTLAELRMRQRRIPEAMATLEKGLKMGPSDPVLLNNMGMCKLVRKDFAGALDCFTQAAGIVPENTRYRSNMATALALLGRRDEALSLYQQILPKEEALENIRVLCDRNVINPPAETPQ